MAHFAPDLGDLMDERFIDPPVLLRQLTLLVFGSPGRTGHLQLPGCSAELQNHDQAYRLGELLRC